MFTIFSGIPHNTEQATRPIFQDLKYLKYFKFNLLL
jgi:hypothetical protein